MNLWSAAKHTHLQPVPHGLELGFCTPALFSRLCHDRLGLLPGFSHLWCSSARSASFELSADIQQTIERDMPRILSPQGKSLPGQAGP